MTNNWFKPSRIDNPKGIAYTFQANEQVSYYLLFNRIDANSAFLKRLGDGVEGFLMEFYHSDGVVDPAGNLTRETIATLVGEFFLAHPQAVIFGVYDDTKVSERARYRLLDGWFNRYNDRQFLKKIGILTGTDKSQIVTLMFRSDNHRFNELL